MSKSIDPETGKSNSITPYELFSGESEHLSKGYSPMAIRFFMLQSLYRNPLDLTDEALAAAEKGYKRLMDANKVLANLSHPGNGVVTDLDKEINQLIDFAHQHMSDDFNTPQTMGRLFELASKINGFKDQHLSLNDITEATLARLKSTFKDFIYIVFGLLDEMVESDRNGIVDGLMNLIIDLRQNARSNKDWSTSDKIRDSLKTIKYSIERWQRRYWLD